MKKIFFLPALCFISLSGFSQLCDSLFSSCIGTFSRNGYYFDLGAVNQVNVNGLSFMAQNGGSRDIAVYYRQGTYLGSEGVASSWTLLGTQTALTPTTGSACPLPLNILNLSFNVCIPQGQKYGFYVVMSAGTGTVESHSNLTEGSIGAQDANIILYTGKGQQGVGAFTGTLTAGLTFQGGIQYDCGCSTSVPDQDKDSFIVYPNPASGTIQLEGAPEGAEINIYDLIGSLVQAHAGTSISISELAPGIYFVAINRGGAKTVRVKFIKQ
jgi:hypothetical protein